MKVTQIDEIAALEDGSVSVRFKKCVSNDGGLTVTGLHRAIFPPGSDIDNRMASINNDLAAQGEGEVDDYSDIGAVATAQWTDEVIAAYQAKIGAAE